VFGTEGREIKWQAGATLSNGTGRKEISAGKEEKHMELRPFASQKIGKRLKIAIEGVRGER